METSGKMVDQLESELQAQGISTCYDPTHGLRYWCTVRCSWLGIDFLNQEKFVATRTTTPQTMSGLI